MLSLRRMWLEFEGVNAVTEGIVWLDRLILSCFCFSTKIKEGVTLCQT